MANDNYFKVTKGTRILGMYHFDSHSAESTHKAFDQAFDLFDKSAPRHKDEAKPHLSVWHKRTIIMTEGPWSVVPAVGQCGPTVQTLGRA